MSKETTIQSALLARIQAVLPNHIRLPNPYKPEENFEQVIKKGYGVALGTAENLNLLLSCEQAVRRDFIVIVTRKISANESNAGGRASVVTSLIEDGKLIRDDIYKDPHLNSDDVEKAAWLTEGEPTFIFSDKDNYMKIEITVSVEYHDIVI